MKTLSLLVAFTLVALGATKLSINENMRVQKGCGTTLFMDEMTFKLKVKLKFVMRNWAVSCYTKYQKMVNGSLKNFISMSPGAIISPYHILTSNVFRIKDNVPSIFGHDSKNVNASCEMKSLIIPEEYYSSFDFDLEWYKTYSTNPDFNKSINRIVVLRGCADLNSASMMILEMKERVFIMGERRSEFWPACLSNTTTNWFEPSEIPAYHITNGVFEREWYKAINCTNNSTFLCAQKKNEAETNCKAAAGSIAVFKTKFKDRYAVLGMLTQCSTKKSTKNEYRFEHVSNYFEEICHATGICYVPQHLLGKRLVTTVPPPTTVVPISSFVYDASVPAPIVDGASEQQPIKK